MGNRPDFYFRGQTKEAEILAQTGRRDDGKRDSRQEQTAAESDSINGPTGGTVAGRGGGVYVNDEWPPGGEMQSAKCRMQNEDGGRGRWGTEGDTFLKRFPGWPGAGEIPNPKFQIPRMR